MAVTADEMKVTYPIPTYRYSVTVGDDKMAFSGVSGLELGFETLEYKDGIGNWFQMPGQPSPINISLKRGVIVGQSQLYDWISSITHNTVDKKDISISLTNDSGSELLVTWNIVDAFPTKLTAPGFDGSSNEIAIEELSLLARRMTVEFH